MVFSAPSKSSPKVITHTSVLDPDEALERGEQAILVSSGDHLSG
jgi:hypothetical protein